MRAAAVAAVIALAGCGDDGVVLRPIIELPPASSDAYPLGAVDELELSVAPAGDDGNLASKTGTVDSLPTLEAVPFGEDLVLHLNGTALGVPIAYGRSCALDVSAQLPEEELSPHIYFSRIVKWGPAPGPFVPGRIDAHSYAIDTGLAVFVGGGADIDDVEVFDAYSGRFELLSNTVTGRSGALLEAFPDGRALVVGGADDGGAMVQVAEVIDTRDGSIATLDDVAPQLVGHAGVTLVDGSIVVAGGETPAGVTGKAWKYSFGTGDVLQQLELPASEALLVPRADHTMTRLGDEIGADVLVIGGRGDAGAPVAEVELYRPLREAFEPIDEPAFAFPRWGHRAVRMPGGFVLVIGGSDDAGPVRELELYDPAQGVFIGAGEMPLAAGLTELAATPLADGRVLLSGGRDLDGNPTSGVFIARLDPIDGRVVIVPTDAMAIARAGHTAVRLCDGTIMVVGGAAGAGAERYNPPAFGRR